MKRRTHRLAFAVAATASAVVMLAGQATAAPTDDYVKYYWDANEYPTYEDKGNIAGSHAWGTLNIGADGWITVSGSVKDTAKDGHGACVQISNDYTDGWSVRTEYQDVTSGVGYVAYYTWRYPPTTKSISVQECLTESGDIHETADGYYLIFERR